MAVQKRKIWAILLLVLCILLHIFSRNASLVEQYYSNGLYPKIGPIFRLITGWLPFSLGDIFYCFVIFMVVKAIVVFVKRRRQKLTVFGGKKPGEILVRLFSFLAIVYLVFNVFWGLNYNRPGIETRLGLQVSEYGKEELQHLTSILLRKANSWKDSAMQAGNPSFLHKALFSEAIEAYGRAEKKYTFLQYKNPSVKPSLFSYAGNYLGFTGYYNPFSGEAQVNTTVPGFLQPYTTCHEIAHQLGFAKEMEANFAGYLAAKESSNPQFKYSVYLDLFSYAYRNLFYLDSAVAKPFKDSLSTSVKADLKEWKEFNLRHKNPIEPIIRAGYGLFLRSNEQPQGILAYDEVTGFLIAFYRKFGEI